MYPQQHFRRNDRFSPYITEGGRLFHFRDRKETFPQSHRATRSRRRGKGPSLVRLGARYVGARAYTSQGRTSRFNGARMCVRRAVAFTRVIDHGLSTLSLLQCAIHAYRCLATFLATPYDVRLRRSSFRLCPMINCSIQY